MAGSAGRLLLTVTVVALVAGACGDEEKAVTTTTTTTEARLTKQEYIRQGDAICADGDAKIEAVPEPKSREELARSSDQIAAAAAEASDRFKNLKPPATDQATHDQLSSLLDQSLIKASEYLAALRSGDKTTERRADKESDALIAQLNQLFRQYGFVKCAEE